MINLVFCSFEVGGFPFKIAEILNNHGIKSYYIALSNDAGHDSSTFHYGTVDFEWNISREYRGYDRNEIIKKLRVLKKEKNIACCFATGSSAYLLSEAGIEYFYWSFGSDLDLECFYPFNGSTIRSQFSYIKNIISKIKTRVDARNTIISAKSVMISPYQLESLRKVRLNAPRFFLPHYFEIKYLNNDLLLEAKYNAKKKICEKFKIQNYIFSSTRHYWYGHNAKMSDNKGNDIIIKSFYEYISVSGNVDMFLLLVNKGVDVHRTVKLIKMYGLSKRVIWIDEVRRSELDLYYLGAEYCFGQFGTNVLTNSVLEPLSFGCISISSDKSIVDKYYYSNIPPIINSDDPKDIAYQMIKLDENAQCKTTLILDSYEWVKNNCSIERFVSAYSALE